MFLNGHGITDSDARGEQVPDDSFLLCFNAHYEDLEFTVEARGVLPVRGRSLVVLRRGE